MPKFTVETKSTLNPSDAYTKVRDFLSSDSEMKKIDPKMVCQFEDGKMCGTAKGSQFKANFTVKPSGSGSQVAIEVDIPLLLTPLKGKITEILQKKMGKLLG